MVFHERKAQRARTPAAATIQFLRPLFSYGLHNWGISVCVYSSIPIKNHHIATSRNHVTGLLVYNRALRFIHANVYVRGCGGEPRLVVAYDLRVDLPAIPRIQKLAEGYLRNVLRRRYRYGESRSGRALKERRGRILVRLRILMDAIKGIVVV